jgi:hypothetical protein
MSSWWTSQPLETASQHSPDGGRLDDGAEGLIVVHPGALGEPLEDLTSLVLVQRAICLELVIEDPLAGDDISPRSMRNQVPCAVRQQGLVLHSATPMGVCECATKRGWDRRQCWGVAATESCRRSTGLATPTARWVGIRWVLRGSRATVTGW